MRTDPTVIARLQSLLQVGRIGNVYANLPPAVMRNSRSKRTTQPWGTRSKRAWKRRRQHGQGRRK